MAYLVYSMFEVSPERALSYGIVSDVVPAAQLDIRPHYIPVIAADADADADSVLDEEGCRRCVVRVGSAPEQDLGQLGYEP